MAITGSNYTRAINISHAIATVETAIASHGHIISTAVTARLRGTGW